MLKTPMEFVKDIKAGMHIVLFFEEIEYARAISFAYLIQGIENKENCFYITSKEDKFFIKKEFEYTFLKFRESFGAYKNKFKDTFLKIEKLPNLFEYPNGLDQATKDILNILKSGYLYTSPLKGYVGNESDQKVNDKDISKRGSDTKRTVLRCMHEVITREQILKNIEWEKNYRNTVFRKKMSNTSIICTYPVDNIMAVIEGNSTIYSQWMTELLNMYDAVIYAKFNWRGAAFNLA
ncbi:MAG: hypothetical protein ACTHL3_08710 [Candidatus Nitrosocosmicus sp.]